MFYHKKCCHTGAIVWSALIGAMIATVLMGCMTRDRCMKDQMRRLGNRCKEAAADCKEAISDLTDRG